LTAAYPEPYPPLTPTQPRGNGVFTSTSTFPDFSGLGLGAPVRSTGGPWCLLTGDSSDKHKLQLSAYTMTDVGRATWSLQVDHYTSWLQVDPHYHHPYLSLTGHENGWHKSDQAIMHHRCIIFIILIRTLLRCCIGDHQEYSVGSQLGGAWLRAVDSFTFQVINLFIRATRKKYSSI